MLKAEFGRCFEEASLQCLPGTPTTHLHPTPTFGCCFEIGCHEAQAGLKFSIQLRMILLPPVLQYWDSRCGPLHLDAQVTQVVWVMDPSTQSSAKQYISCMKEQSTKR